MNKNSVDTKGTRNWAAMVIKTARVSVFVHAAVFVIVNTMLVAVNVAMAHQFIEWPVAWWAVALTIHTAAVAMATEGSRVRIHRMEMAPTRCR